MDFDSIRPVISGIIGGGIALWLGSRWQRRQPAGSQQENEDLIKSNKIALYLASGFFFAGIIAAIALYKFAGFANNDWRPFGLGVGGGCVAALLTLAVVPILSGQSIRQAYIAFAASEKASPLVVYAILGTGALGFFWTLGSL